MWPAAPAKKNTRKESKVLSLHCQYYLIKDRSPCKIAHIHNFTLLYAAQRFFYLTLFLSHVFCRIFFFNFTVLMLAHSFPFYLTFYTVFLINSIIHDTSTLEHQGISNCGILQGQISRIYEYIV